MLLNIIASSLIVSVLVFFGGLGYALCSLIITGTVKPVLLESLFFQIAVTLLLWHCYLSAKDRLTDRMFKL